MTIRDVARRANVGIATVSRVLNGHPSVRPETRARVLAAIEELDYIPNTAAQRLSSGQINAVGVFAPYFTRPAFVQRLAGIQEILGESVYDLVLFSVQPNKYDDQLKQVIRQRRVDGVLIVSMSITDEHRLLLEKMNMPIVLIEPYSDITPCVVIDNQLGGQLATEHLLALGHERIAFVGDERTNPFGYSATNERYVGYLYALAEANIEPPKRYSSFAPLREHSRIRAIQQALELLSLPEPPTAIFAASDTQAVGVLEAARQLNVKVPEQLSIIGYDDIEMSLYLDLTTIRQPMFESGRLGAQLLLDYLSGNIRAHRELMLDIELIERGSTAPPLN